MPLFLPLEHGGTHARTHLLYNPLRSLCAHAWLERSVQDAPEPSIQGRPDGRLQISMCSGLMSQEWMAMSRSSMSITLGFRAAIWKHGMLLRGRPAAEIGKNPAHSRLQRGTQHQVLQYGSSACRPASWAPPRTKVFVAVEDLPGHQAADAGFAAGTEHPEGRVRRLDMDMRSSGPRCKAVDRLHSRGGLAVLATVTSAPRQSQTDRLQLWGELRGVSRHKFVIIACRLAQIEKNRPGEHAVRTSASSV